MENSPIDWTTFRKRITIEKTPEKVYASWAIRSEIQQWFLQTARYYTESGHERSASEPCRKGDTFTWKWHNWDFEEKGRILEANGKDKISFTFGPGGNVHVMLNDSAGATEVILIQEQIPTDDKSKHDIFVGCATGWTFWLANLKAWLEYGITLHATGLNQDQTTNLVNS